MEGIIEEGKKKALKYRDMVICGLGMPINKRTQSGWPSGDTNTLLELCGNLNVTDR